jgi:hypothetical protein
VPAKFWYLSYFGNSCTEVLQGEGSSRDLFNELLQGRSVGQDWTPPPYELVVRRVWPDWMAFHAPLLSNKAIEQLRRYIEPCCELLPWIKEPNHEYTLLNVTACISRKHWHAENETVYGKVIANADVIRIDERSLPDIFLLEGYAGRVFVSDALARTSVDAGLTGVAFIDPLIPALQLPFIKYEFGKRRTGFIESRPILH